jgi:hypothetical protein
LVQIFFRHLQGINNLPNTIMKRLKLIITYTMSLLLISTLAQASDFETINGLKYIIEQENDKAILFANDPVYSGDIIIPEKVTFDGRDYPVKYLGDYCFYYCTGLTSVAIPSSVKSFGDGCFYGSSSLTSIDIPLSVTSLGNECFDYCSGLTSITIPPSVTFLGDGCFSYCSGLTSMTIPFGVTFLGWYCFMGCSGLTSITIPSSVTSFGNDCFNGCSKLTSLAIPSSVSSLGTSCFEGCSGITSISCYATTPPSCQNSFYGINTSTCNLYVPQASIDLYKAADGWNIFSNIYAIEGSGESTHINSTSTSSIVASCNSGIITISGFNTQENVTFYSRSGEQLGTVASVDGRTTYAVNTTGDIVIAKFGGSSIKIATK